MMKYWRAARLEVSDLRAFPLDFYTGFVSLPIQIAIVCGFWTTTMGISEVKGFTAGDLAVYFVSIQVLQMALRPAAVVTWELWTDISRGNLVPWLMRPLNYPTYAFMQKLADGGIRLVTGIALVELPVLLLTHQYSGTRLLLGLLSSLIGFTILFALHFVIGTLTVYVGNVLTLRDNVINLTALLGGGLLPVAMLPGFVQKVAGFTPLPSTYYTPARILSDPSLSAPAVLEMFRIQLGWMVAFVALALALWGPAMRSYSPQGG